MYLEPKSTDTFLSFLAEVQLTFKNCLKAVRIGTNFKKLELIIKDTILAAIELKNGMLPKRAQDRKGTAYFDVNKDKFTRCLQPE